MAKASISQIAQKLQILLKRIEERHGDIIEVDEQFYWHIPFGTEFGFPDEPNLDVGDLESDLEFIEKFDFGTPIELSYFISILRYLVVLDGAQSLVKQADS